MKLSNAEKILLGVDVALALLLIFERRQNKMNKDFKETVGVCLGDLLSAGECKEPVKELSPIEKEAVANHIKAMSEEEMRVALENIPAGLIFSHLGAVMEKNRKFVERINDAVKMYG